MAGKKKTVYPDTRLIVGLIVLLFGLVYVGAAWFPETVKIVFNIKGDQSDGQFSGFGTIGDFFGGVINPILTFITIYLLLVSIRIQREELEATRAEMQAATAQAKISASAAQASILINKISERPHIVSERLSSREEKCMVRFRNYGRGVGVINSIIVYLHFGKEPLVAAKMDDASIIVPSGIEVDVYEIVFMPGMFRHRSFGEFFKKIDPHGEYRASVEVIYADYFLQKWSTEIEFIKKAGNSSFVDAKKGSKEKSDALSTLIELTQVKVDAEQNPQRPPRLHPDR